MYVLDELCIILLLLTPVTPLVDRFGTTEDGLLKESVTVLTGVRTGSFCNLVVPFSLLYA
jgi:hypothetical protein